MNFLIPLFLGAGLLIGLPIALHFLRRRPKVIVIFPSLQFLGPTALRETRRHQIRRWLTLLMRCLIILLICAAFSRPFWSSVRSDHGRAVIVVVDNSFSMQTKGRWEKLRGWAADQLSPLTEGDRAGLLLMNPEPHWLVPLTGKLDQVRALLAASRPGYETTRYEPALRLANDALVHSGAPELTLVWMTDEQQNGWQGVNFSQPLSAGVKMLLPPAIDSPPRQAAIMRTSWENAPGGDALRVEIRGYLPLQDTRQMTVSLGDQVVAKQSVILTAGQSTSIVVPVPGLPPDQAAAVKVALDPDDLPADDTFYAVHDKRPATRVYLTALETSPDSFDFLRHAIDSTKQISAAPLQAADLPDTDWPVDSVVVVRGDGPFQPPLGSRLDAFLKAGGTACFFLNGSPAQTDWMKQHHVTLKPVAASADTPLHLRNWDSTHPLITPLAQSSLVGLLDLEFYHGVSLDGVDAAPLATWDDGGPAIAEVTTDGMRFLACGFDAQRDATDWMVHASFVPFVHSALVWLSRQQASRGDWRVGDIIPLSGTGAWQCLDGPGPSGAVQVSGSVRPQTPGLYRFQVAGGGPARLFAVNLNTDESDLTTWPTPNDFLALTQAAGARPALPQAVTVLTGEESENQQRVWWWLLALAVLLILAELRLANRTSI